MWASTATRLRGTPCLARMAARQTPCLALSSQPPAVAVLAAAAPARNRARLLAGVAISTAIASAGAAVVLCEKAPKQAPNEELPKEDPKAPYNPAAPPMVDLEPSAEVLAGRMDPYGGVNIDPTALPTDPAVFETALAHSVRKTAIVARPLCPFILVSLCLKGFAVGTARDLDGGGAARDLAEGAYRDVCAGGAGRNGGLCVSPRRSRLRHADQVAADRLAQPAPGKRLHPSRRRRSTPRARCSFLICQLPAIPWDQS